MELGKLFSEGKGKKLYETDDPSLAIICYKDDMRAYNGLKRGRAEGKGELNNHISARLFTLLAENGVPNHFVKELEGAYSLIRRLEMIPLGVKVRNFVAGSLGVRLGLPEGTRLQNTVVEYCYKNQELDNPLVNITHITALGIATMEEVDQMSQMALQVNDILQEKFRQVGVELVDFKLEFGRRGEGIVMLADEVDPDTCRFWDAKTHESLDIDLFRRNLGNVEEGYREILRRLVERDV